MIKPTGWNEFCAWREIVGLPRVEYDKNMAAYAQIKAEQRARERLKDGHDGHPCPPSWREGTGEAKPMWGWLTCCQEEDAEYGGCGMCVGLDEDRYMVLLLRGGTGKALIPRDNIPIHDTSSMNPDPPRIER
jgi:hypothetical protein